MFRRVIDWYMYYTEMKVYSYALIVNGTIWKIVIEKLEVQCFT